MTYPLLMPKLKQKDIDATKKTTSTQKKELQIFLGEEPQNS